jgi:UDP-glucose 6-dehydrogenase
LAFGPGANDVREAVSVGLVNALPENEAGGRAFDPRANAPARSVLHPSAGIVDTAEETAWGAPALFLLTE